MKKILYLTLLLCCMTSLPVQGQSSKGRKMTIEEIQDHLNELVKTFCNYVEVIGSTDDSISRKEKDKMRLNEVPRLFHRFDERRMITTRGHNGKVKNRPKMYDYFLNLLNQSEKRQSLSVESRVVYDLDFKFYMTSDAGLDWGDKPVKTYDDGTKLYQSSVMIYQTYLKETIVNGNYENKHSREEEDAKEMTIYKLVRPNNDEVYKLGDITRAERTMTSNR